MIDRKALVDNHLARAEALDVRIDREPEAIHARGPVDFMNFVIPLAGEESPLVRELLASGPRVRIVPWGGVKAETLLDRGYRITERLSFMVLDELRPTPSGEVDVRRIRDEGSIELFNDVMLDGFGIAGEQAAQARQALGAANRRNVRRPELGFYLASVEGEAAGTALLFPTGDLAGIYAVTTVERHRRKGVCTALVRRAIADALASGSDVVSLQVDEGGDAERLYLAMGFRPVFTMLQLER